MSLRIFKYVGRAVYLEENEFGEVTSEHTTEDVHLYTKDQVMRWLDMVDEFADKANLPPETNEE